MVKNELQTVQMDNEVSFHRLSSIIISFTMVDLEVVTFYILENYSRLSV